MVGVEALSMGNYVLNLLLFIFTFIGCVAEIRFFKKRKKERGLQTMSGFFALLTLFAIIIGIFFPSFAQRLL